MFFIVLCCCFFCFWCFSSLLNDFLFFSKKVYDVTEYLDEHPGGSDIICEVAGADATEEYQDAGHTFVFLFVFFLFSFCFLFCFLFVFFLFSFCFLFFTFFLFCFQAQILIISLLISFYFFSEKAKKLLEKYYIGDLKKD